MMVLHRFDRRIEHARFADLPRFLRRGDLMVRNNTRVIPARVFGRKEGSGGKVELLFLEEVEANVWDCLLRSRRRPALGAAIELPDGRSRAVMVAEGELGRARVRIESDAALMDLLEAHGEPPLPPYVQRDEGRGTKEDRERYQTIFARAPGAVAAPTAGLHFTPEMFTRLHSEGVDCAEVTLHVGVGTFRPVSADHVRDHVMEAERYEIPAETCRKIAETKSRGGRVAAIGTTTTRTLESCHPFLPADGAKQGRTRIFIYPPYEFRVVDVLLTNFHLPKSTLIMMVSAFAGREFVLDAYAEAVREKYRFYSYGDCMLIL